MNAPAQAGREVSIHSSVTAVSVVALVLTTVVFVGCQGRAASSKDGGRVTADGGLQEVGCVPVRCAAGASVVQTARPSVETGAYTDDPRVREVIASWALHVGSAVERVRLRTGLHFAAGVVPRVQLEPLGDEDLAWRLESRVEEGRRVPYVRINLEQIAVRRESADIVLARAVAAAVFEDAHLRLGGVSAWAVRAGEIVAAGIFDERVQELLRRVVEDGMDSVVVSSEDPNHTESTALAAILVLASAGEADATSRFLRFTAEGDDPDLQLARLVGDPHGTWTGEGRKLLQARLMRLDARPWRMLGHAERALETLGRAGLEAELESGVPTAIAGHVAWLRAKAAADEGDLAFARTVLRAMGDDALGQLDDLPAAMELWARVEDEVGGDAARAALLRAQWIRDFPLRARERGLLPNAASETVADMDGVAARSQVVRLLEDHRAGAARRLLEALGERASAPELEDVRRAVARAEEEPDAANMAANEARVLAWLRRPSDRAAADVRDGGTAAAEALGRRMPRRPGPARRQAVRLLVETTDLGRVIGLLAPSWTGSQERLRGDLDVLLTRAPYPEIHIWVEGLAGPAVRAAGGDGLWDALRFGLDPGWLQAHPGLLGRLRDPDYAIRRDAFDEAVRGGGATPELVGRALADPATLLRRLAATAAGRAGFHSLLQTALRDEAWVVRQAAVIVLPDAYSANTAVSLLRPIFLSDPSGPVRQAAARALLVAAPGREDVVDGLLARLPDEEPGVRLEIIAAFQALPKPEVIALAARGLRREIARPKPRPAMLAALFRLFRQGAGWEAGYVPGMAPAELERTVERVEEVARRIRTRGGGR